MLSTKVLTSSGSAKSYFLGQDDYYLRDTPGLDKNQWLGQGAKILGLSGQVNPKDFENMLSGILPDGSQLGKMENGKIQHRPGFDLTFSAPKSVSILAEIGQDARIYQAHDKAVATAISYIEKSCAQARKTIQGKTDFENTENIVAAIFRHDTSRKLDPQLHTHCVVMNATCRSDGKWRSLASDKFGYGEGTNGFIERVREHKIYFGAIYRSSLAYELKQLGYEIEKTHSDGRFEIAGISREVIEHFSQRREEITALMQSKGWTSAKAADFVTLQTRNRKENIPPEQLYEAWTKRSDDIGFDAKAFVASVKENPLGERSECSPKIQEAVQYAIDHLSERDVCLSHNKLLNTAISYSIGDANFAGIADEIERSVKAGNLIPIEGKSETYYTTKEMLQIEKDLIAHAINNRYSVLPFFKQELAAKIANKFNLAHEQFVALENLTSNTDRFTAITGIAGSGKTHVLSAIAHLAKDRGLKVAALAPTSSQMKKWHEETKINTDTIAGFLERQNKANLILIDNAHLISSRQLNQVFERAESMNARVILAGDTKAYLPIAAGSPFAQLIKSGIKTENLSEVYGKTKERSERIKEAFSGNVDVAFGKTNVIEKTNRDVRLEHIADHYAKAHENTLLLMPSKKECGEINGLIREKLKENNVLQGKAKVFDVYLPKSMTSAEKQFAKNYAVGEVLRFGKASPILGIKHGDYRKVLAIDAKANTLKITDKRGRERNINLQSIKQLEVFTQEKREIMQGDKLQAFRSKNNLTSGDVMRVKSIRKNSIIAITEASSKIKLKNAEISNFHIDYAYALTPYRAQHLKADNIIAHMSSESFATNQRSFYRELASARDQVYLYTDNKDACLNKLKGNLEKNTAFDAIFNKTAIDPKEQFAQLETQLTKIMEKLNAPVDLAKEAAIYAMNHLAEREAAFTHKELLKVASTHALGDVSLEKLEHAVLEVVSSGELIKGQYVSEGTLWTTKDASNLESQILGLSMCGKSAVKSMGYISGVKKVLEDSILRQDQKNAVEILATTKDRVVLVQGYAGTGKTTMLVNFQSLANKEGYDMHGLAPSHTAVEELTSRGIKAQTLQSFLIEAQKTKDMAQDLSKKIYVLDEASMVSSRDMLDLLKFVNEKNARLIAVGDKEQLASPEAGKPFVLLQKAGVQTVSLTDIQRQDPDKIMLREAVKHIMQKDFAAAFTALDKQSANPQIIEIENKEERLQAVANDYLNRDPERRANTLVITPLNADRTAVNALIREGLKEKAVLAKDGQVFAALSPKHMTQIEMTRASNYDVGDIVRFNRAIYSLDIQKNTYLMVDQVDARNNTLVLKAQDKTVYWQLQSYDSDKRGAIEVYKKENRELCAGDQIIWTRTDKANKLINGDRGKIIEANSDNIVFKLPDGQSKKLNPKQLASMHFDHSYAVTAYAAQGKTKLEVIDHEDSTLKHLTNQRGFYVAITRAKQQATIYTDNKDKVVKKIQRNTGEKSSALEITGKIKDKQKQPEVGQNAGKKNTPDMTKFKQDKAPNVDIVKTQQMPRSPPNNLVKQRGNIEHEL